MRTGFWSIDSEYLKEGRQDANDTICITASNGSARRKDNLIWWWDEIDPFYGWLREHSRISKTLITWTLRPEYGSLASWGLTGEYDEDLDKVQRCTIEIPGTSKKLTVLDIQPFFKTMENKERRLGSLEATGEFLAEYYQDPTLRKLPKPEGLGERFPTDEEKRVWARYAKHDAYVTARTVRFLAEEMLGKYLPQVDFKRYYSFGTIAAAFFDFPRLHVKMGKQVILRPNHREVRDQATFAGRSEAFWTGAILGENYYNDMTKQYPVCTVVTNALMMEDIQQLSDYEIQSLNGATIDDFETITGFPYGWLKGIFESDNELWGLPVRGKERNYYVTGRIPGLFHTYDLLAAKARPVEIWDGFKPKFNQKFKAVHDKYAGIAIKLVEGEVANWVEKQFLKGVTNSSTGRLGMDKPQPSTTTNFPAYNTIVARAHWEMSKLMDHAPKPILYMDTDSLFTLSPFEGVFGALTDLTGEWSLPVKLGVKGRSDRLLIFRSKHYYQNDDSWGFHAWKPWYEDWFTIVKSLPPEIDVRADVKGTFHNRMKKALGLQVGRWFTERKTLQLTDLTRLFAADDKRSREDYDSYGLVREGKALGSKALSFPEFVRLIGRTDLWTGSEGQKYDREFVERFLHEYQRPGSGRQDVPI